MWRISFKLSGPEREASQAEKGRDAYQRLLPRFIVGYNQGSHIPPSVARLSESSGFRLAKSRGATRLGKSSYTAQVLPVQVVMS